MNTPAPAPACPLEPLAAVTGPTVWTGGAALSGPTEAEGPVAVPALSALRRMNASRRDGDIAVLAAPALEEAVGLSTLSEAAATGKDVLTNGTPPVAKLAPLLAGAAAPAAAVAAAMPLRDDARTAGAATPTTLESVAVSLLFREERVDLPSMRFTFARCSSMQTCQGR